jgi:type IV pilus assembly protein PilZ
MPDSDDRRQDGVGRAAIELRVEYRRLNTFFYDYTKNISRGGTFIRTERPLPVGTGFVFRLTVPGLAEPLVLRGEVRWVRGAGESAPSDDPETQPGMGIQLVYDDENQRRAVEALVEKLMVENLGPLIAAHLTGLAQDVAGAGVDKAP